MKRKCINIKKRIGILYWDIRKRQDIFKNKYKRKYREISLFILGFFIKMPVDYVQMKRARCLIICAHPDDETIFFYSIMKEFKPYVICMSNRGNKIRRDEFKLALEYQNASGVLLNFPDMVNIRWKRLNPFLIRKLKKIKKKAPNIEFIYTHNNVGESGHHHHFDLSLAVREVFSDKKIYVTSEHKKEENLVADYDDKEYIIRDIYKSQYKMLNLWCPWFKHYMRYEYFEEV